MSFTVCNSGLHLTADSIGGIAQLFSLEEELAAAIRFERALCAAQAKFGLVPTDQAEKITQTLDTMALDHAALFQGVETDGIYVPSFVKQVRAALPEQVQKSFHKDTTSQDVIDTSLMLRLKVAVESICDQMEPLEKALTNLKSRLGQQKISARTRMQEALPFTFSDRMDTWLSPLIALRTERPTTFPLQLGGPIGMMHKQVPEWAELVEAMATDLSLTTISNPWHTDRRVLIEICTWLTSVTTALGKIGADILLMAQNGIDEITLETGGSSSAMPHKKNPVLAEALVSAANYNAHQMGLLHQVALHEQERSGTSWTVEFMTVPTIVVTTAKSLENASRLIAQVR